MVNLFTKQIDKRILWLKYKLFMGGTTIKLKKTVGILILASLMILTACSQDKGSEQVKLGTEFLTEFYSFNKDGRFDTYMDVEENSATGSDEDIIAMGTAMQEYYSDMAKYLTEEELNILLVNRFPHRFERYYAENNITLDIESIDIVQREENKYDWTVTLFSSKDEGDKTIIEQKGQLSFDENNKINIFYFEDKKTLAGL